MKIWSLVLLLISASSWASLECELKDFEKSKNLPNGVLLSAYKVSAPGCSKKLCFMDVVCTLNGEKMDVSSAICQPNKDGTCPLPKVCFTEPVDPEKTRVHTKSGILEPGIMKTNDEGKVISQ